MEHCPFCGSNKLGRISVGGYEYAIECVECKAVGPIRHIYGEAEKAWNTRWVTEFDALDVCGPECGCQNNLRHIGTNYCTAHGQYSGSESSCPVCVQ